MPNFANGGTALVRTTNLESAVSQVSRNNSDGRSLTNAVAVPDDVLVSMQAQGMLNTNAFSPGSPINPTNPVGTEPRQWEYMIGQNIVQAPRSTEDVSFDTIRQIVKMYDIAQMCIEVRQDELRNLEWDIVPDDEKDTEKYSSEIKQIRQFFERPDGYTMFDDFQNQLAYDWLAYDALTVYPHLTKGGKLGALEAVDGTTITPMVDLQGRTPVAPAPAYVQWQYGLPWVWLSRDQLIYRPHRKRNDSLYGFTPIEWLLNNINTDIRYQLYFLQYFTEGSVPEAWINAPENVTDPTQIKQIQTMYDAVMSGDQAQKHKVKWIPAGSKVYNAKDTKFEVAFPQFLLTKTCGAFKVTPAELGFTEKVNKSSGETQENVQYRRSIKPSATFFASIYTSIIHRFFGLPNLRFKYLNLDEQEDLLLMAQRDEIYIKNGVLSPDEVRTERLGLDVDANNPTPRMFVNTSLIMTVDDAIAQSSAKVEQIKAQTRQAMAQADAEEATIQPQQDPEPIDQQQQFEHPEITTDVDQQQDAQKAALDFFIKRGEAKFKNPKTQAHVEAFAPKLYKVLKAESKRFSAYVKRRLERLGKDASDPTNPNTNNANEIITSYTSPTFIADLTNALSTFLIQVYVDSMTEAYTTIMPSFEVDQQFHAYADQYARERTAQLVTNLSSSTKQMLQGDLINMMNQGMSPYDMVQALESDYAFSESRAFTIARTETGFAWNNAAITSASVAGAGLVYVYDGDHDPECQEADAQVWTVDYAMDHLLEHPNCVRSFSPCIEDVDPDRGGPDYVEPEKPKGRGRKG